MFIEIKDDKLLSWCENPYLDYVYVDIDYKSFEPEKYAVVEGVLTDISNTQEYQQKVAQAGKEEVLASLKSQIAEIDTKRIRAICEPTLKDPDGGQTWLDYYTQQIVNLRNQIASL